MDFWSAYWTFTAFVFGAIVGSFLNVCIWRLPRGASLSDPPSHCPACGHRLSFLPDMIPLVSQLWYRSRCRYCGEKFSWRYFWVEFFTAAIFALIYVRYGMFAPDQFGDLERTWSPFLGCAFAAALIAVFFIDLEHYQIPDLIVLIAFLAAVGRDIFLISRGHHPLWQPIPGSPWSAPIPVSIWMGLLGFYLLWQFATLTTALIGKEAMGAGDSLLMAAMGAFLTPWPLLLLAFLVAVALGTVGGLAGLIIAYRAEHAAALATAPGPAESLPPEGAPDTRQGEALEPELTPWAATSEAAQSTASPSPTAETATAEAATTETAGFEAKDGGPAGATHDEPETEAGGIPILPGPSRWGRLVTVMGTWAILGGIWFGLARGQANPGLAVGVAMAGILLGAALIRVGVTGWLRGDKEWLPAMDELFAEGDPGPRFIPFGPYLVMGTFVAMLVGRPIVEWYCRSVLLLSSGALRGLLWD